MFVFPGSFHYISARSERRLDSFNMVISGMKKYMNTNYVQITFTVILKIDIRYFKPFRR